MTKGNQHLPEIDRLYDAPKAIDIIDEIGGLDIDLQHIRHIWSVLEDDVVFLYRYRHHLPGLLENLPDRLNCTTYIMLDYICKAQGKNEKLLELSGALLRPKVKAA